MISWYHFHSHLNNRKSSIEHDGDWQVCTQPTIKYNKEKRKIESRNVLVSQKIFLGTFLLLWTCTYGERQNDNKKNNFWYSHMCCCFVCLSMSILRNNKVFGQHLRSMLFNVSLASSSSSSSSTWWFSSKE